MIHPPASTKNDKTALKIFGAIGLTIGLALLVFVRTSPDSNPAAVTPQAPVATKTLPSRALGLPSAPASADREAPAMLVSNDEDEQDSLGSALSAARHEVEPITEADAALEQNRDVHLFAQNPGNQFTARFLDNKVRLASGRSDSTWQAEVSVPGLPPVQEIAYEGGRVEYDRGNVIEWYENLPEGMQQGFIVREPTSADGVIRLEVALDGLEPHMAGENVVHLHDEFGEPILSYSHLLAWDAAGKKLPATMEVAPDGMALVVSTQGAAYPITIDPVFATLQEKVGTTVIGDGKPNAYFGWSVAISGTTAVIGAPGDDTPLGTDSGSAYVFQLEKSSWLRQAKLLASDGEKDDFFGQAVGISGNTIVVGSPGDDTSMGSDSGSVHVFIRAAKSTSWTPIWKVQPDGGAASDEFGISVAIDASTILVGARLADTVGGINAGSVYAFTRGKDPVSAWAQQAKLIASDGAGNDFFGSALALSKNMALIGAPGDDTMAGSDAGSAYVFIRSGTAWTQQTKLEMTNPAATNSFGSAVSLSKDTAVVGAPGYDDLTTNQGCAVIFKLSRGLWTQVAQLVRNNASEDDFMGQAVAISGSSIAVGAPGFSTGSALPNKGAIYTYLLNRGIWTPQSVLIPASATGQANSGYSLALDRNLLIAGAPSNNTTAGDAAGSAYLYRFDRNSGWMDSYLSAGNTNAGAETGTSVAIFDNTLVAGAPLDDTPGGTDAGRAFILTRIKTKWYLENALRGIPGKMGDQFGQSVAVSKDHVIIGVPGADLPGKTNTGEALAFTRNKTGWDGEVGLFRQDAEANDGFGTSVAISGNTAIIGTPYDDIDANTNAGSAYVYTYIKKTNSWNTLTTKLTATDAAASDFFGSSVSISNNLALVGALGDDNAGGAEAGSAYIFQNNRQIWTQQAKLLAVDAAADDRFGSAVSLFGNMALIGAPFDDTNAGTNAGSAYLFTGGKTWLQKERLQAVDGAANDFFGSSVALHKKNALIGAPVDDTTSGGTNAGSAYNFGPVSGSPSWAQLQQLTDQGGADNDRFGFSVALSANTAVIGAAYDDTFFGGNTGSILIFVP